MARKCGFTLAHQEKIVQAVRVGATLDLAAHNAGIDRATLYRWMQKYPELELAIREAEGQAAVRWLSIIDLAASGKNTDGTWQAAAWKLERRYPQMYGRSRIDVAPVTREDQEAQDAAIEQALERKLAAVRRAAGRLPEAVDAAGAAEALLPVGAVGSR